MALWEAGRGGLSLVSLTVWRRDPPQHMTCNNRQDIFLMSVLHDTQLSSLPLHTLLPLLPPPSLLLTSPYSSLRETRPERSELSAQNTCEVELGLLGWDLTEYCVIRLPCHYLRRITVTTNIFPLLRFLWRSPQRDQWCLYLFFSISPNMSREWLLVLMTGDDWQKFILRM